MSLTPEPTDLPHAASADNARAIAQTQAWLQHAVIGLNLCPFAKAVVAREQVRVVASGATEWEGLRTDLCRELELLAKTGAEEIDTTLVVCTGALAEFDDFNDFLEVADDAVQVQGLEGTVQIASFHPHYRFEGTDADDITNATNRAPWPVLQLLREASIERVLAKVDDPDAIYRANMQAMEALGESGWAALSARWRSTHEA